MDLAPFPMPPVVLRAGALVAEMQFIASLRLTNTSRASCKRLKARARGNQGAAYPQAAPSTPVQEPRRLHKHTYKCSGRTNHQTHDLPNKHAITAGDRWVALVFTSYSPIPGIESWMQKQQATGAEPPMLETTKNRGQPFSRHGPTMCLRGVGCFLARAGPYILEANS